MSVYGIYRQMQELSSFHTGGDNFMNSDLIIHNLHWATEYSQQATQIWEHCWKIAEHTYTNFALVHYPSPKNFKINMHCAWLAGSYHKCQHISQDLDQYSEDYPMSQITTWFRGFLRSTHRPVVREQTSHSSLIDLWTNNHWTASWMVSGLNVPDKMSTTEVPLSFAFGGWWLWVWETFFIDFLVMWFLNTRFFQRLRSYSQKLKPLKPSNNPGIHLFWEYFGFSKPDM